MRSRMLVVALFLCAISPSVRALDVPPAPTRWVTDRAGLLSTTEVSLLDTKLQNFEQSQGTQFIVYVFPSLEGESMEDFTIRCVEAWKVGRKKYDNGLVLFVFAQDKRVRIEVGYGLEGTITDAFSSRVIREQLAPPFQRGAYGEGLNAAADAIIRKIRTGEEPVPPHQPARGRAREGGDLSPFTIVLILFVVFFIVLPMLSRGRGGCGGCLPFVFFPWGGRGTTFGGGGFSGGGGWGGGGGFSGGGGGFGGGGASGGW